MADKRYYWVKLDYRRFENGGDLDFLMSQKNGAEYIVLYMMLCLNTRNTDGEFVSKMGEVVIPYDVDKIVRDCKYFSRDTVMIALELYKRLGLIYEQENGIFKIANYESLVGSESQSAKWMREHRARQKELTVKTSHCEGECEVNVRQEIRDKRKEKKSIESTERRIYYSELSNEISESSTATRKSAQAGETVDPVFIMLPIFGRDEHGRDNEVPITEGFVRKMEALYRACDVRQSIRNAVGWSMSHPKNRKKEWQRFLTNWLQGDNDEALALAKRNTSGGKNSMPPKDGKEEVKDL